jgi:N-hydroxyarylamine O-acetyltransferase
VDFDLSAYLARIGLKEPPAADVDGLLTIQRAHRLAIPFENLDILLGRGISVDPEAIFDKLVLRRRGGYCFEQNSLFLAALNALGFDARPLLARVWLFANGTPPKTHMLLLVTINGQPWLADAGFGGSYTPPMPLEDVIVDSPDGAAYQLMRDNDFGWMLARSIDGQTWDPQYSFTVAPVWPADIDLANHYTSTVPGGLFTNNAMVSIVLPNGFASLINRDYSRSSASGKEQAEIASPKMLQMRLSLLFGIDLTAEEIEVLNLF